MQYPADLFDEILASINFPNHQNFNDATETYDEFIQKIMVTIVEKEKKDKSKIWITYR